MIKLTDMGIPKHIQTLSFAGICPFAIGTPFSRRLMTFLGLQRKCVTLGKTCFENDVMDEAGWMSSFRFLIFFAFNTSFTKLCTNPAGRDSHYDRLDRTDLLISYSLFFGNAKVILHSRITSDSHRRSQMYHERCLRF